MLIEISMFGILPAAFLLTNIIKKCQILFHYDRSSKTSNLWLKTVSDKQIWPGPEVKTGGPEVRGKKTKYRI